MIMEKIGMPVTASTYGSYGGSSGGGGSWGGSGDYQGGFQPGGDSVNINPATGQPDYSAQWADYYRNMGMLREAEAIEAQMRVRPIKVGDTFAHMITMYFMRFRAEEEAIPTLLRPLLLQLQLWQHLPTVLKTEDPIIPPNGLSTIDQLAR